MFVSKYLETPNVNTKLIHFTETFFHTTDAFEIKPTLMKFVDSRNSCREAYHFINMLKDISNKYITQQSPYK